MGWRQFLSRRPGDSREPGRWPPTVNAEIVQAWFSRAWPDAVDDRQRGVSVPTVPREWKEIAGRVRQSARECPVRDDTLGAGFEEAEEWRLPAPDVGDLRVRGMVDRHESGALLKHAVVYGGGVVRNPTSERTLWQFALAIEPDQPPFHMFKKDGSGLYCHLLWPQDWEAVQMQLAGTDVELPPDMPVIITKESRKVIYNKEFDRRLPDGVRRSWFDRFHVYFLRAALAAFYVEDQGPNDLVQLALAAPDVVSAVLGKIAGAVSRLLLVSRAKPCPNCRYRQSMAPGLHHARIWPINRYWCLVSFHFNCPQCKRRRYDSHFAPVPEPGIGDSIGLDQPFGALLRLRK